MNKYPSIFKINPLHFIAPQGIPLHHGESKLIDAFNQTTVANTNYGTITTEDPTQEAYDRYVKNPYD